MIGTHAGTFAAAEKPNPLNLGRGHVLLHFRERMDLSPRGTADQQMANQLKNLMQGLYYPAITGTGVVLVMYRATMHETLVEFVTDYALGYGILFVLFFSASFVAISIVRDRDYLLWEFFLDVLEVVCVFYAFYYLGLFDTSRIVPPNFKGVYASIAVLAIFQALWRLFLIDDVGRRLVNLRIATISVAALGYVFLHRYTWFNVASLLAYFLLVVQYIRTLQHRTGSIAAGKGKCET